MMELSELKFLANQGHHLRVRLQDLGTSLDQPRSPDQNSFAQIYVHATSIYLSGVYDYESIWNDNMISVPTLPLTATDASVCAIERLCSTVLESTKISPLLLLLPLRVAGSRCHTESQQRRVRDLLHRIQPSFAAADAFMAELKEVWKSRKASSLLTEVQDIIP
jgi:hypothetical protein